MISTRLLARRGLLLGGGGLLAVSLVRPAAATPEAMRRAIAELVGKAEVGQGLISLDIPPLVENGNVVPLTVAVESPMTEADHVTDIAIFTGRNPLPQVAHFHLGPRAGRARVTMRMRLATSQAVTAIARLSDGTFRGTSADVIVTLAACVES